MSPVARVVKVASTVVTAVAVVLAVSLVGVRLLGMDVYSVLSGSMEPTYHTGSVIWVKNCEPEDVEVGDPITFVLDENLTVATHRVVSINEAEGEFTTKGDANDFEDANPVLFENLIGKPVFSVPGLGYFVSWLQNPPGTYIAISIGAVFLILMLLPDILSKDGGEQEKAKRRREAERAGGPGSHAVPQAGPADASRYARGAGYAKRPQTQAGRTGSVAYPPQQVRQRQAVDPRSIPQVANPANPAVRPVDPRRAARPQGRHQR